MRRPLIPVLLLLAAALAGCAADPDDAAAQGTNSAPGEGEAVSIEAPVWEVGDSWTWGFDFDGFSSEELHVVSAIEEGDYILDTDDDFVAFEAAQWGHPGYGPIRASDLAMSTAEGETSIWFDFPLQVGKQWSVDWFGQRFTNTVVSVDEQGAVMETVDSDGLLDSIYTYSVRNGWFGMVTFYDGEGEEYGSVTVTKESPFTGEVVRAEVTELRSEAGTGTRVSGPGGWDTSEVEDGAIYASMFVSCQQGTVYMAVGSAESVVGRDPGNEGVVLSGQCPYSDSFYGVAVEDVEEDRTIGWGYTNDIASPDAEWSLTVWLAEYERFPVQA